MLTRRSRFRSSNCCNIELFQPVAVQVSVNFFALFDHRIQSSRDADFLGLGRMKSGSAFNFAIPMARTNSVGRARARRPDQTRGRE